MSKPPFPYQFIAIEGNLGAGKTSLAQKLANDFGSRLILEQFTDNPFLPCFYENPDRYAFQVELFFMTERYKQLQEELAQPNLFQKGIIADYFFLKTLLFAKNNLNTTEYRLFQRLFGILNTSFPKPDLLLYLHQPVPRLLKHIAKRGRSFEQNISPEYLHKVQHSYLDFFKTEHSFPIVIADVGESEFLDNPQDYQKIVTLLQQKHKPGITHV